MSENNCYLCQEPKGVVGHNTQSCPNVKCKKCGQKGHIYRNCPNLNSIISQEKIIESIKEKMEKSQQEAMEMKCKKYLLEHLKIEIDMQIRKQISLGEKKGGTKNSDNGRNQEVEEMFDEFKRQLQDSFENLLKSGEVQITQLQKEINTLQKIYETEVASYKQVKDLKDKCELKDVRTQATHRQFQDKCQIETVAAESLRKIYESEIKNLESKAYQSQIKMEKELKDHEIQVKEYQSKMKGLQEKYDVDIVAQQQINNDLKMMIANLENKLKICQKSNQDLLEIEQYGSQTEFSTLLRELKNKQNEVGEYQSEIIDLQNKYNHAHAVALPHVINASKKQIEDLQKDNESLKNGLKIHQMMSMEVNDCQPQPHFRIRGGTNFEGIENEFQSKFSHIEERYKQETSVYQERIKDLMESNENLKKDNENFISCIVDLKEDAKNLKKDDENLKAKLKDLQERYKIELNGYRERLVDLREDNKNLKKEDENLKDKLKDLQERHIKETYAYQKYIKATEKDKEDMKLVGLKTQKESDQVFLKELKKYQSEINDLQEKLKQSQSQVKDLQEKFEKESDARQFAESMKEIHASQVNVVEFGMKSKLMKLQEQSIGEKKHCQSQIDDLQKKYTKEISSHKLTESQKETFRLKLEGLVIREKEYQSNVRDLQEKLKKESTDQQKLKNLIIELRYKLNEIEVECKQSQCQVKDLQEKCKKESEAQQLAESLKEIYASQVNVVEFEMKWCQSELKKLQENSIGDKKDCQSQINDLQEKYRKEISAHQLTKSQNETYKLGLEYQTRREREYQSTIMNLKKQGPWGRGGP